MFELAKISNINLNKETDATKISAYDRLFEEMSWVLGLRFEKEEVLLEAEILQKIEARQNARKAKDFALADAIRQELLQQGILLEDTREGVKYKRV